MTAAHQQRNVPARLPGPSRSLRPGLCLALCCAGRAYAALDRRMPEARILAEWLAQNAAVLDLPLAALPDDDALDRARRRGIALADWQRIGSALQVACARLREDQVTPAGQWLAAIADALRLDPLDERVLDLALHYYLEHRLERLFDRLSDCRGGSTRLHADSGLVALLLDESAEEVDRRLEPDGRLRRSGLLRQDRDGALRVLEPLLSLIRRRILPQGDLYDQLLGRMIQAPLPWDAFAHLGRQADVAASVLQAALAGQERGVNLLLYGPPGTGKTSFAATLAARIGARLRPVAETDEYGGEPQRDERLAGLRLAQHLAPGRNSVLLFDEAEDLFTRHGATDEPTQATSRVFVHRLLEQGAVPVIWTANDIGVLGPAVLRRMTMCLELKVPDLKTRIHLWRQMGAAEGIVLPESEAARLARLVPAAPAVASTALRATRLAGGDAETARLIVEGVARAVHGGSLPAPEPEHDATYDSALINADADLAVLTDRLTRPGADRSLSLLLSGPPGSGKSAWIRHLAGRMGLPVLQKRTSDLLDAYLGGTERNIAGAFAEARDAGAFLVFDEADSLLLDRADASRSWEISQVNEMLTWMEQHPLPFACTTNLPDRLDRASLRRFLVKLRFDWLTEAQARLAFRRVFGLPAPPALDALRTLAPADFALVRRKSALMGATDPDALVRLLAAECDGRVGGCVRIGFAATG